MESKDFGGRAFEGSRDNLDLRPLKVGCVVVHMRPNFQGKYPRLLSY